MKEGQSIIERVNSMDDIFAIGGKTLEQIISPNDTADEVGYKVLKFGIAVLNENVKVDHSNANQVKYEPRMYYTPGVGLAYGDFAYWYASTYVGPALCYLSYEKMKHGLKIMAEYYNKFFNSSLS